MSKISRLTYASLYGPTTGDRVRLADTNLICRIEHDFAVYGEEAVFGGGKSVRDGMAQSATVRGAEGAPDNLAALAVRACRDAAGVEEIDVGGLVGFDDLEAPLRKLASDGRGFRVVQFTAERMESDFLHCEKYKELPEKATLCRRE